MLIKANQSLFKFRAWSDVPEKRFDKHILTQGTVWFASPRSFNDPFDCRIPLMYHQLPHDEMVEYLVLIARGHDPNKTEDQIRNEAIELANSSPLRDERRMQWAHEIAFEQLADYYGILSFAGVVDNILLWSHYADCHRGLAVEFDSRLLDRMFEEIFGTDEHVVLGDWVKYPEECPTLVPHPAGDQQYYYDRMLHKSSCWSYEKEYRYIYHSRTNLARAFPKDALKAVYLGCQMSDTTRNDVIRLVREKYPHARLYSAKKRFAAFGLSFEEMR